MHDLVVIGGGPAGCTAAVYSLRRGVDVLLLSPDLGGKARFRLHLRDAAEYPVASGAEVMDRFVRERRRR